MGGGCAGDEARGGAHILLLLLRAELAGAGGSSVDDAAPVAAVAVVPKARSVDGESGAACVVGVMGLEVAALEGELVGVK